MMEGFRTFKLIFLLMVVLSSPSATTAEVSCDGCGCVSMLDGFGCYDAFGQPNLAEACPTWTECAEGINEVLSKCDALGADQKTALQAIVDQCNGGTGDIDTGIGSGGGPVIETNTDQQMLFKINGAELVLRSAKTCNEVVCKGPGVAVNDFGQCSCTTTPCDGPDVEVNSVGQCVSSVVSDISGGVRWVGAPLHVNSSSPVVIQMMAVNLGPWIPGAYGSAYRCGFRTDLATCFTAATVEAKGPSGFSAVSCDSCTFGHGDYDATPFTAKLELWEEERTIPYTGTKEYPTLTVHSSGPIMTGLDDNHVEYLIINHVSATSHSHMVTFVVSDEDSSVDTIAFTATTSDTSIVSAVAVTTAPRPGGRGRTATAQLAVKKKMGSSTITIIATDAEGATSSLVFTLEVRSAVTYGAGLDGNFDCSASQMSLLESPEAFLAGTPPKEGDTTIQSTGTITGFSAGDLALIITMQDFNTVGALETNLPESSYVGRHATVLIESVSNSQLNLADPLPIALTGSLATGDSTRVIVQRVPQYASVNIPADCTIRPAAAYNAQDNDGAVSTGIVTFVTTGHVQVDGTIDASSTGFRGGRTDGFGDGQRGVGPADALNKEVAPDGETENDGRCNDNGGEGGDGCSMTARGWSGTLAGGAKGGRDDDGGRPGGAGRHGGGGGAKDYSYPGCGGGGSWCPGRAYDTVYSDDGSTTDGYTMLSSGLYLDADEDRLVRMVGGGGASSGASGGGTNQKGKGDGVPDGSCGGYGGNGMPGGGIVMIRAQEGFRGSGSILAKGGKGGGGGGGGVNGHKASGGGGGGGGNGGGGGTVALFAGQAFLPLGESINIDVSGGLGGGGGGGAAVPNQHNPTASGGGGGGAKHPACASFEQNSASQCPVSGGGGGGGPSADKHGSGTSTENWRGGRGGSDGSDGSNGSGNGGGTAPGGGGSCVDKGGSRPEPWQGGRGSPSHNSDLCVGEAASQDGTLAGEGGDADRACGGDGNQGAGGGGGGPGNNGISGVAYFKECIQC